MQLPASKMLFADPSVVLSDLRRAHVCDQSGLNLAELLATYRSAELHPRAFLKAPLAIEKDLLRLIVRSECLAESDSSELRAGIKEIASIVERTYEARKRCLWEKAGLIVSH